MEQLSISVVAIPWITTTSLFNCTGEWTSGSGQGIESGTTTICLTFTYSITKVQTPAHTQFSTSPVSAGQTYAYVIHSTLSTEGISPVATETSLQINIASQKSPLTFSTLTASTYNASIWTSVTTLNSLRIIQSTISPSSIYPEITLTLLSPNPTYSITTPYLNSTADSSISSSSSSHYSTSVSSSSSSSISSLSSPSTSTHTITATTTIECASRKTTDTRIDVTTGVLLVVVGLACFVCMVLLLSISRDTMAILQKNWRKRDDRNENSERRGGGIDEERGCRCGWTRYEMEGVGRPPEVEPGLDHGALIRYEMSAGDEMKGAGQGQT
ncbi:hypothetical protein EYC80_010053 [Monilinia laxa]|uniref:Uncharacterized protein n=1 Tax=Monilinia laxa TaxID=61186 RepID=A0A5N6JUE1_MONLA|nr:hypothetical protein EYC80_010053 [Monilinia laxa]